MWSAVQNVAQVTGVDALSLIALIVRTAETARRNKKTCRELVEQVKQIGDLLRSLEEHQPGIMRRPETSGPLRELHETLRLACTVVESCGQGGWIHGLCAGGSRASRLRDVQSKIAFYLQLFPIVSHLHSTRLLVQVINSAAPTSSGGAEEEVLRSFQNLSDPQDDQSSFVCSRFQNLNFSQLRNATNNFSLENQIEQGPLATLYKGQLHGNHVTIKKHSVISSSEQNLPPSMSPYELCRNEVQILPKLQHNNIVKLLGSCAERSERIVVYEHMENGSLEDVIFVRVGAGFTVYWPTRFRIIEGVAQGAVYLHNHSRLRVVHRDLKPSNIFLDSDMNPRISNFDLAKVLSPGIDQGTVDCVVGSVGFIAPEYMKNGTFSGKTDVYSFGVMVLEIISGKRWTRSIQKTYYRDLLTWAFNRTTCCCGNKMVQRLKGFMHPTMHNIAFCGRAVPRCLSLPTRRRVLSKQREIRRCVRVSLLCIQEKPQRRPDMPEVTRMLSSRKKAVLFPRRPGYATESPMYAGDRSTTTP
ncbi:cysteine-rich receptor-like protein kinase 44 isoform X1 [Miscanthus floridulus]|uniref:cysteine-rich receptor-like protein kinase 44 isoform X1 n=1 Tax=Miscanthus floridulus TaxID=154761 RepID=UPI00345869D3